MQHGQYLLWRCWDFTNTERQRSPLGCWGTVCSAWVSSAGVVQEGHRQSQPLTRVTEGATASIQITPHMQVPLTSRAHHALSCSLLYTLALDRCQHKTQTTQHPLQETQCLPLHWYFLRVAGLDWPSPRAASSSSSSFTPKLREESRSHPQHVQLMIR